MKESSKFFFSSLFFPILRLFFNSSYLNSRARKDTRGSRFKTFTGGKKKSVPTSKGRVVVQFATVSAPDLAVE